MKLPVQAPIWLGVLVGATVGAIVGAYHHAATIRFESVRYAYDSARTPWGWQHGLLLGAGGGLAIAYLLTRLRPQSRMVTIAATVAIGVGVVGLVLSAGTAD